MTVAFILASSCIVTAQRLDIQRTDDGLSIEFDGILQSGTSVHGPWSNVADVRSPYKVHPTDLQGFYRSLAAQNERIFNASTVLTFSLTGPFQHHFNLAFAGLPDGIFPPIRSKPYFDGILTLGQDSWPVSIRVRGNSSLQECPFPKLKVKIARKVREGTPFEIAREFKIGTHCADGGQGNIGRLRDEIAAFREVLVYEAMQTLGFISPRIRRTRIEYQDTTETGNAQSRGWGLAKMAFIMDHIEVVAERLHGRSLEDEEIALLNNAAFPKLLITELQLFHTMVGNWDYQLSEDGKGLWNTEVIELPDKSLVPVAGDFDLAAWVTGTVRVTPPRDYLPDLEDMERQIRFELTRIANESGNDIFQTAREKFLSQHAALDHLVNTAEVDEEGRDLIRNHFLRFFQILESAIR